MQGGSGAMGSLFFYFPPTVVVVLDIVGEGGMAGVSTGIYIRIPSDCGGRDG